jgi:mRNA interferase RelE/StbE
MREPLKKKLAERLKNPRVASAALSGMPNCYKIKLGSLGYRLVYRVDETVVFVTVIAVGKRDRQKVYESVQSRLLTPSKGRDIKRRDDATTRIV